MIKKKIGYFAAALAAALAITSCSTKVSLQVPEKKEENIAVEDLTPAEESEASSDASDDTVSDDAAYVEKILEKMTLRQKVEQKMIVAYRNWQESADSSDAVKVTELNDGIREDLATHQYGGVILFGENFVDASQTIRLISDIQKENQAGGGIPLFVSVDQEGGRVSRTGFATAGTGNMALAATNDPENAKTIAGIFGEELKLLGINMNFAPVVDVNNNPNNPIIGVRSFSDSPQIVSRYAASFVDGLHEAGMISALKHFPGHGNTDVDSHTGFPRIDSSLEELKEFELVPFQALIDAGADMVMTAHIQYPQIETGTYTSVSTGEEVHIPATMSQKIITDILRGEMGFDGVVVTDALDMKAITDNFAPEDVMYMTMNSGADLLLLPGVNNLQSFEHMKDMVETAVSLVEEGKVSEDKINDSVRRILTLKKKYGILDRTDFDATDEMIREAQERVGSSEHRKAAWDIAQKALTLVKNDDDAFPIRADDDDTTLILFGRGAATCRGSGDLVRKMQKEQGVIRDDPQIVVMVNDADNEKECIKAAKEADHCILVYRTANRNDLDPSDSNVGFSSKVFDTIISDLHKDGKKAVFVSCQLPYDAARFQDADAILLSYEATAIEEIPPESGAGSAYVPNLAAALMTCFGDGNITGCLPVNVPLMDDKYQFTDKVLYESNVDPAPQVVLGDERFDEYIPLLEGKRVAIFSNQTGIVGDDMVKGQHILDALIEKGVDVTAVFSPEHGFRGTDDAGGNVGDYVDEKTGVPILSVYQGKTGRPSEENMDKFDTLVVDIQDVGLRYYTYYISMYHLMDACAAAGKDVVILDRPDPNGFYVDGPLLKKGYESGVGLLPIPVVHGMTLGELAQMINGEGWLSAGKDSCKLTVIPCENYTHSTKTILVRDPSPNLKDMRAVYLYASTCFFENTYVSVGRGTDMPFEVYGSPYLDDDDLSFTFEPKSMKGATDPPFKGEECYGKDLRGVPLSTIWEEGIDLSYLIDAYNDFTEDHPDMDFFAMSKNGDKYWIDLLSGSDELRKQMIEGKSAEEIEASWQEDISAFMKQREPYLLYE